jgi:lipoate-protein ligase A
MLSVRALDLTLATPEANLACDEALLDWCDAGGEAGILRFWEPPQHFVVLGYANAVQSEVNVEACRAQAIPILRRCSGGGTVLQGPGCLNYALVLAIDAEPRLASIAQMNRFVMERHRQALSELLHQIVLVQGHTDLTLGPLKFSGNAQRRKRRAALFHGTFLLQFDLGQMEQFLRMPSRLPTYRKGRPHRDFLVNLNVPAVPVKQVLRNAWGARGPFEPVPDATIAQLVQEKYSSHSWNLRT